jgi:hypothetical protein
MKSALLLAAILILASASHAQVREEMAPPAPAGVPDTEYCPPDTSNGIDNFDSDWSNGYSVEINAPSGDSGGMGGVSEGPAVVDGTNDGPYVPSTFMSYEDALDEGKEKLAEMGGVVRAQAAQAQEKFKTPVSDKPEEPPTAEPLLNAKSTPKLQPILVKQETVAEAARENREKQGSREKPKVIVTQDASGGIVVTEEPQKSAQNSK